MSDKPTKELEGAILDSRKERPGGKHYRAYVGPPAQYDFMGATQFSLLTSLGLREEDTVLDFGCGSLRAGRFIMTYLLPNRYFGIEPNAHLVRQAIRSELGGGLVDRKRPSFDHNDQFDMSVFDIQFDAIVAQSVFSHTGLDLFSRGLESASKSLKPRGQFLFTVLSESAPNFDNCTSGMEYAGWLYPGSVTFPEQDVESECQKAGLHVQRLPWFHPRQTWFRAVKDPNRLIADTSSAFRDGRVLFDDRFEQTK